jgi:hypothetical protein
MAKPVINTTQSVLGFLQWQTWAFQPTATGQPTGWQASTLPPGVTMNATTGFISGAATAPGVYLFQLTASNADGVSDPVVFACGIEASGYVQPSNILETIIDVTTRRVFVGLSLAELQAKGSAAIANTADEKEAKKVSPLMWLKAGDDVLFSIRFIKGGVVAPLQLSSLKFVLKEFEPETEIVKTTGNADTWQQTGSGQNSSFQLWAKIDGDALRAILSDYEQDEETSFKALGEFQWLEANPTTPRIGPAQIVGSSRTFGVTLPRDLTAN